MGHMLVDKKLNIPLDERDYESMKNTVDIYGREMMSARVGALLEELICDKYGKDRALRDYLAGDIEDYCTELGLGGVRV